MATAFALVNVRVFDGRHLTEPTTVEVENGLITRDAPGAERIDAHGAVLLPGLIDAHVHLHGPESLDALARYGVTTALDMAAWPPELPASLRGAKGTTDIMSAGIPAIGPAGPHARMAAMTPLAVVTDAGEAEQWVADRIAEGSEYIKIVMEAPGGGGLEAGVAKALVEAAHARGKQVVAHASSAGAYTMAVDSGADFITHCPIGPPADPADVERIRAEGRVTIPTLIMMEGVARSVGHPEGFAGSMATVSALHAAGVPILAGTDANDEPGAPFPVRHGRSMHEELRLLVEAGLSPAEALRSATSLPARHFSLTDRGVIAPGKRADLLLIDGDPLADITATERVLRVWCAGIEHETAR
ncbi:imidazolonepropionase-like amidohydrolase [Thermocatellispora tengchongensis]|uniref:Imidazolonepropionase-like amidohydrolase n=1 Tax=Thermocatellispora tengchongensis TaxID=1073253 RepID=A0A840PFI8_9ACTN|nr:amidohydrolase family protein [Thermocatellispora tengchongensis]MBB5137536.1 imidazolonepropionase-like amidohydrolase [Thermocatellispora tengchongensis]